MQQIKIFKAIESDREELEREINRWIRRSGARVLSISGNISGQGGMHTTMNAFSGSDVLIVLLVEIDPSARPAAASTTAETTPETP